MCDGVMSQRPWDLLRILHQQVVLLVIPCFEESISLLFHLAHPVSIFMVPQSSVIEIETLTPERRPTQVVCDGQSLGSCTHAKIQSGDDVRLAFLEGHNFTETLVRKSVRS